MAEVVGLISGGVTIVKLFHTTIQVFDIVNTSKAYSIEIHILCSKLQIERARLVDWGELVGLTEIHEVGPQSAPDSRIYHPRYRHAIAHHLKRLLELFQNVDSLLEKHGVRLDQDYSDSSSENDASTVKAGPSNKHLAKGPVQQVFLHQLETLRKSIKNHQTSVPWFKKAKWAVYQGDRFKGVVDEIRDLVDGLHKILPDVSARTRERLIQEIEVSEDISSLDIVQAATIDSHNELAEAASARSETLSVSMSTQHTTVERSTIASDRTTPDRRGRRNRNRTQEVSRLLSLDAIFSHYSKGGLEFQSQKKDSRLLSCDIQWIGVDDKPTDDDCGFLPLQHSAFDMYLAPPDICDLKYLDVEASRQYLGSVPGSLSIAGYIEETARHYKPQSTRGPKRLTVNVSRHLASQEVLYKRLAELKYDHYPLDNDPSQDSELLQEVLGDKSRYGRTTGPYQFDEQIEDLKSHLRNCVDFTSVLSVLNAVLGDENGRDIGNFLSQVILSKELSRRLCHKHEQADSQSLANSIIVSNRFLEGATLVAFDDSQTGRSRALQDLDLRLQCDWSDRQIDGLVRFAQLLKWPYLDTTRTIIEDTPLKLSYGESIGASTGDWMYCTSLPGKWASLHAMSALVECTPDLNIDYFPYFEGGLSLNGSSYWRMSSVLGKVFADRQTRSAMGWVGPCPGIDIPTTVGFLHVESRKIGPQMLARPIEIQTEDLNELRDSSRWFIPQPPVSLLVQCRISSIKIKPLYDSLQAPNRATIEFTLGDTSHEFILYTNPHLITPPRCRFGPHKVHESQRRMYEIFVEPFKLKEFSPSEEDAVVINAQCKGGEVFARAWCAEIGQSAVVASEKECCFACAVKCASSHGTGVKVLIWSSSPQYMAEG